MAIDEPALDGPAPDGPAGSSGMGREEELERLKEEEAEEGRRWEAEAEAAGGGVEMTRCSTWVSERSLFLKRSDKTFPSLVSIPATMSFCLEASGFPGYCSQRRSLSCSTVQCRGMPSRVKSPGELAEGFLMTSFMAGSAAASPASAMLPGDWGQVATGPGGDSDR